MKEDTKLDKSRVARATDKFDRVLKRHIRRLLEVSDSDNLPPYNLNMIASLLVLSEREKELADYPNSPLKHYTRETFLKDLDEIGIDSDETVLDEIQNLIQSGYIATSENEEYQVLEPANRSLSLLDAIFPSLPGLSLVAYILQAIDEVLSGRKEMILAIRQFDETLLTRGESVSKQRIDAMRRQRVAAAATKKSDPAFLKQRETYIEKLKALRSKRANQSSDTTVVLTSGSSTRVEIREVFPRAAEHNESESVVTQGISDSTEKAPNISSAPLEAADMALPPDAPEEQQNINLPLPSDLPMEAAEIEYESSEPDFVSEKEAETVEEEAGEPNSDSEPQPEPMLSEDLIAKKIQAFEEQLAMNCPVCKEGKIRMDTTEKGKTYYFCSNNACGLVSWGKPHHITCPLCENSFLIEFQQKDGHLGLKCPRATCSFQHPNLDIKTVSPATGTAKNEGARKVLVRKKPGATGTQRRLVKRKK